MSQQRTPANIYEDGKDTGVATTALAFVTQENEPGHNQGGLLSSPEAFDSGDWAKTNAAVTADQSADPTGGSGMDRIENNTGGDSEPRVLQVKTISSGATVALSGFLRPGNTDYGTITVEDRDGSFAKYSVYFELTGDGAIHNADTGASGAIEKVETGIYRCSVVVSLAAGSTSVTAGFGPAFADGTVSGHWPASADGEYIDAWGAQLEEGSEPSDYLVDVVTPTEGRAATHKLKYDQSDGTWVLEEQS